MRHLLVSVVLLFVLVGRASAQPPTPLPGDPFIRVEAPSFAYAGQPVTLWAIVGAPQGSAVWFHVYIGQRTEFWLKATPTSAAFQGVPLVRYSAVWTPTIDAERGAYAIVALDLERDPTPAVLPYEFQRSRRHMVTVVDTR